MKTRRFSCTALLLTLLSLAGVDAASACKYCWSAENADTAEYARQAMSSATTPNTPPGAFPLDATINQFQAAPAPTSLAALPAPGTIVTSAADLRAAKAAILPAVVPAPLNVASVPTLKKPSTHYADAGLLGLAAAGGVFCWRTRRKTGPGR